MFVKAVKGTPFKGWADVPVGQKTLRLQQSNAGEALGWFVSMVAAVVQKENASKRLYFVPVPSSSSTKSSRDCASTTTHRMAEALAKRYFPS